MKTRNVKVFLSAAIVLLIGWGLVSCSKKKDATPPVVKTDLTAAIQYTVPVSPTSHRSIWRLFSHSGKTGGPAWRAFSGFFNDWIIKFSRRITAEDISILPSIQRGMSAPIHPHGGLISVREERVFHFQRFVQQACESAAATCVHAVGNEAVPCGRATDPTSPCA